MFKHKLGEKAKSKVTGLTGIIINRSESLYGCNRYYVQPKVDKDMKTPDGWWVDEEEITTLKTGGVKVEKPSRKTKPGGPMGKVR